MSLPEYLETLADMAAGTGFGIARSSLQDGRTRDLAPDQDPEPPEALEQGDMGHVAVLRPRLCQRKGVFFIAARQWFAPAKLQGIQMMKAAKDGPDLEAADSIAKDLAFVIATIFGGAAGALIAAPSARHSAFIGKPHFASMIADNIAGRLGCASGSIFEVTAADRKGHHPAREKELPRVKKQALPVSGRVILIDDLATSGQTIEWHVKALQESGCSVSAAVWVYGSTAGVGR